MKRKVSLILILAMCICLCACGSTPEEAGEIAYENIEEAAALVDQFASDVYEGWEIGLYYDNERDYWSIEDLAVNSSLSLDMDELTNGAAYYLAGILEDYDCDDLSEEEQEHYINIADLVFNNMERMDLDYAYGIADIVVDAYIMNGMLEEIEDNLNEAKNQLKVLSNDYPDYEPLDQLKAYYKTVNTFLDFIYEHSESGQVMRSTISDYKDNIRDCEAELEYVFG